MTRTRFRFGGVLYTIVDKPLFAEFAWIEDQAGIGMEEMRGSKRTAATLLLSLRRAGAMLTWDDIQQLPVTDFEWLEDEEVPDLGKDEPEPQEE